MTPAQREQYDRFPSNLSLALLLADGRLAAIPPTLANALRASSLSERIREAIILRVAYLSGSAYERTQHVPQARKAGFTGHEIGALGRGDTTGQPEQKFVRCHGPFLLENFLHNATRSLDSDTLSTSRIALMFASWPPPSRPLDGTVPGGVGACRTALSTSRKK